MAQVEDLRSRIHRKNPYGCPMSARTTFANGRKSAIRSKVGHVFDRQEGRMGHPDHWPRPRQSNRHAGDKGLQHGAIAMTAQPRQARMTEQRPVEAVEAETGAIPSPGSRDPTVSERRPTANTLRPNPEPAKVRNSKVAGGVQLLFALARAIACVSAPLNLKASIRTSQFSAKLLPSPKRKRALHAYLRK